MVKRKKSKVSRKSKSMKMDKEIGTCDISGHCHSWGKSTCGYFLGFLGAVIYYIQTATGFWNGTLGVLKALVWPAFLVYEVLKFVGA